jgi:hypothetical protein
MLIHAIKTIILTSTLLLGVLSSSAVAETIPRIESADLNKKPVIWPDDLPQGKTLLIFGFDSDQQTNIDTWVRGLNLKSSDATAWYEVPLIDDPGSVGRWFINNGMRSGIKSETDRSHVVTVYSDKAKIMKRMGMVGEDKIHVFVIDQKGGILAKVSGDYSQDTAKQILKVLKPAS